MNAPRRHRHRHGQPIRRRADGGPPLVILALVLLAMFTLALLRLSR